MAEQGRECKWWLGRDQHIGWIEVGDLSTDRPYRLPREGGDLDQCLRRVDYSLDPRLRGEGGRDWNTVTLRTIAIPGGKLSWVQFW